MHTSTNDLTILFSQMDRACKNRKSFSDSFAVELIFAKQMKGMFSKSTINIT